MNLRVNELQDLDSFAEIAEEWDQLVMQSEEATVFASHPWLWNWLCHLGNGREFRILLVRDESDRILGGLPLVTHKLNFGRFGFYRELRCQQIWHFGLRTHPRFARSR